MQMAARSKYATITEAEAEEAALKDDGYWQVEKEVIDAWGTKEPASSSVPQLFGWWVLTYQKPATL